MKWTGSSRLTVAAIAAAVSLALGSVAVSLWATVADGRSTNAAVFSATFVVAFAAVGAVVAAARPENRVGWAMLAGAALSAAGGAGADLAYHGIVAAPGSVPAVAVFAIGGSAARSVGWTVLTLGIPLLYPDGRLQPSRRNWLPRAFVVIIIGSIIDPLTDLQADLTNLGHWHNPIGLHRPWDLISAAAFLSHVPLAAVATIAVVVQLVRRYRRGTPLLRQQLRLFVGAAAVPIVAVPIVFTVGYNTGPWLFSATVLPLPFAIGFAVLARGLYDLRTAANRTLVWLTLSAVVAGVYALVIAGVGNRLDVRGASWLPWVAAAVVAVSFAPLRDGLQRTVNRLTFGRWDEPYDVLAALGKQLEATADVTGLLEQVVDQLRGLGLDRISILDEHGHRLVGTGGGDTAVPLVAYGRSVGELRYALPSSNLRSRDRQLLDDLAGHLAGVLHAHALTLDLQRAREHLVLAREEERRRLRRDLHDGLGPSLAGHLLRLDLLAGHVSGDPAAAAAVATLTDELRSTMADVRRVVEGLRPPSLDELGLRGSIEQMAQRLTAGSTTDVSVSAEELPKLPAAVEVAAFRIVSEAVTNVVRHAGATRCDVRLLAADGRLLVSVSDDGAGLQPGGHRPPGHGLQTMRERAHELRGRLEVAARTEGGTLVTAELPLPPAPRMDAESATAAVVS
ncbi:MAG TPA: sensor histidine kinase [Mycobacteriales bacterium]|nr:sensor histidine kinase [Mycobacteriales bacterium]